LFTYHAKSLRDIEYKLIEKAKTVDILKLINTKANVVDMAKTFEQISK